MVFMRILRSTHHPALSPRHCEGELHSPILHRSLKESLKRPNKKIALLTISPRITHTRVLYYPKPVQSRTQRNIAPSQKLLT